MGSQLKQGNWLRRFEQGCGDLEGVTLGIIGFGRIGQRLAELIGLFGMTVLAHDLFVEEEKTRIVDVDLVDLDEILYSKEDLLNNNQ